MAHDQAVGEGPLGHGGQDLTAAAATRGVPIDGVDVHAYELATEAPQSDGTLTWTSTTMVVAEVRAAGVVGLGYTYEDAAAARLIERVLAPCVRGGDALAVRASASAMRRAVRNQGLPGVAATAIAAVDVALWDLAARLVGVPLAVLAGAARWRVPVYASGGFTSTPPDALARELAGYVAAGHRRVKIKIGRDPGADPDRVRAARDAIGPDVELMVDANGAYTRKQALAIADHLGALGVTWFEEPVSADDLDGLRLLRDRAPAPVAIAAGEYGYDAAAFRRLLDAGAVDVLQADATRCQGITGFLVADALCAARSVPLSAHTAPALHLHAGAAATQLVHVEQFADHARMEALLFDGAPTVEAGALAIDRSRPGHGLALRRQEAARHAR